MTSLRYPTSSNGPIEGKVCFSLCRLSSRKVAFRFRSTESTFVFASHCKHCTMILTCVTFKNFSKTNIGLLCPSIFLSARNKSTPNWSVFCETSNLGSSLKFMDMFRLLVKSGRCTAYDIIRPTRKPTLNYSDFLYRQQKNLHLIKPSQLMSVMLLD
jgi:hypothetical protein